MRINKNKHHISKKKNKKQKKTKMIWYEFFVKYLMQPIILLLGLVGNMIGLVIFLRKKMVKIGPLHMYQILFAIDTFCLLQTVVPFLQDINVVALTKISSTLCKLNVYMSYSSYILSPMALIYISIEKLVSIKYPAKRFTLRKKRNQVIISLTVTINIKNLV